MPYIRSPRNEPPKDEALLTHSVRKEYLEEMSYLQPEMIVWIDKTRYELHIIHSMPCL